MIEQPRTIIVDLEATCWEKGTKLQEMETIEIGALLIDNRTGQTKKEFDAFVKPVKHPALSEFCTGLTSIQQEDVDAAGLFPEAWRQFLDWAGNLDDVILASWGAYDDKQLRRDCQFHGLEYQFEGKHVNLKILFGDLHGNHRCGMKKALRILDLKLEGTHHRGLDDARNIGRIYSWMLAHDSFQQAWELKTSLNHAT